MSKFYSGTGTGTGTGAARDRVRFLLALLATLAWCASAYAQAPIQTYFVPMPEDDLLNGPTSTFETINGAASGNVNTLISIAIAADGTIIYYDHWIQNGVTT